MKTTLTWNNIPLGPCAQLCYRERVTVVVTPAYRKPFKSLRFRHIDWIPSTCRKTHYGNWNDPTQITLNWYSPDLYDRNHTPLSLAQLKLLDGIPIGTVLAVRAHQYQFDGHRCDGNPWGPFVYTVKLESRVVEAKDGNGNPIPVPNATPPRNKRTIEWFVI